MLVNAVSPAAAKTAMFATMTQAHIDFMLSKIPMGRFLEVDEAAAMVAWLASEECSVHDRVGVRLVGRSRATSLTDPPPTAASVVRCSRRHITLPEPDFGSASMNWTIFGTL